MTLKASGGPIPVEVSSPVPLTAQLLDPMPISLPDDQLSAFWRLRVVNPQNLGDLILKYQVDPEDFAVTADAGGKGTVAHVPFESSARLAVSDGTAAAFAQVQTKDYYRYQAGRGIVWFTTGFLDAFPIHANQVIEWGRFDAEDGHFFRARGAVVYLVERSSVSGAPVDVAVAQADWNVDRMDGSAGAANPSGLTLDVTKGNIYEVRRQQWLSVGDVWVYVNGHLVHVFRHAGLLAVPYMRTAQLPVTARIENVAAAAAGSWRFTCGHVGMEGAVDVPVHPFGWTMPASVNCLNGVEKPLFAIRPKAVFPAAGPTNRSVILPTTLHVSAESQRAAVRLVWDPTSITGATWAVPGEAQSAVEIDTAGTVVVGGTTLLRPFCPQNEGVNVDVSRLFGRFGRRMRQWGSGASAGRDVLAVIGVGEAGASSDIRCSLIWDEVR